eukprot:CAMPEP_0203667380 /NCGR_PEP_ID=MMETSP0090-20130426/4220_1 /ASSEMBLY_ACC=CAM_ASM_001088 /TAXON_ID=426623 /ORGANISM="Chaetoceros affinis, Strain CCMP159" /LENGTH=543 /DNA_ID=CAMNT_0050531519 /DNA_START=105 /DNA_END=1736 /DNA_ORIENTATION=+
MRSFERGSACNRKMSERHMTPSSSNGVDNNDAIENRMIGLQKEKSESLKKKGEYGNDNVGEASATSVQKHLERQKELFDNLSDFFNSEDATPDEVKPLLSYLINKVLKEILDSHTQGIMRHNTRQRAAKGGDDNDDNISDKESSKEFKILDVGCGVGALFPFYVSEAESLNMNLNIVGLDLSPNMISLAKENAQKLLEETETTDKHSFAFENGDFVEILLGENHEVISNEKSIIGYNDYSVALDEQIVKHREQYDGIVINACFGNFYDPVSVLTAASKGLKNDGIIAITHPLGAQFVKKLHTEDPETVPHNLPSQDIFEEMIRESQPLSMYSFIEEIDSPDDKNNDTSQVIYYASAKKVPQITIQNTIHLRGPVDSGYGRGGKKLGVPTANLPCSLFANALQNVPTGVYFGWAVIEGDGEKKGRNAIHKAVCNVGYSPTFDGEENKEKIVEAHLIVNDGDIDGDFYGETMRLALIGFLRPEMKFESFPALISAIMNDKANAKDALDLSTYTEFTKDPFLMNPQVHWIGGDGGDESASYKFIKN